MLLILSFLTGCSNNQGLIENIVSKHINEHYPKYKILSTISNEGNFSYVDAKIKDNKNQVKIIHYLLRNTSSNKYVIEKFWK